MNDPAPAVLSLDFLLWFHLKGLLLLSLAAFFSWLLGSGSAGQRHLCWTSGAVSILLLAAVTPLLGIWTIPVPEWDVRMLMPTTIRVARESPRPSLSGSALPASRAATARTISTGSNLPHQNADIEPLSGGLSSDSSGVIDWLPQGLIWLWGLGLLAGVARILTGELWTRKTLKQAVPLANADIQTLIRDQAQLLGIRKRDIRVRVSQAISSPFICGFRRPVLVLPTEHADWPRQRLRRILVHELAHVKRFDTLSLRLAQLATTVQCLNPLCWIVLGKIREQQELACDDQVLAQNLSRRSYAEDLLWLARQGSALGWQIGALGKASALEGRIRSLLDTRLDHQPLGRRQAGFGLILVAAIALFLGGLGFSHETGTAPFSTQHGWVEVLDQGRIRFDTESTIELEGIGTLRGSSRDRILHFTDPVEILAEGRPAPPGLRLQPNQLLEVRSARGKNFWRIRLAPDPPTRVRGRKVGSARGTSVSFVFEPGEPSFYYLNFSANGLHIQGWVNRALEVGIRLGQAPSVPNLLRVRAVLLDGPADRAGLLVGDEVTAIGGRPATYEEFFLALATRNAGDAVHIRIRRNGETQLFTVQIADSRSPPQRESWKGHKYNSN